MENVKFLRKTVPILTFKSFPISCFQTKPGEKPRIGEKRNDRAPQRPIDTFEGSMAQIPAE